MKDFFISYTGIDSEIASWIAWTLEDAGYDVVFQKWDFATAGRSIIGNIHQATIECERTIAVLSPDYFTSDFTIPEWEAAVKKDPTGKLGLLVPVIVRPCEIKGLLDRLAYISLLNLEEEQATAALLQAIKTERAKPASKPLYTQENQQQLQLNKPLYPGTLPPVCNLPRRNPNFTGRDAILETLRQSLASGHHTALTQQAIHGLGGIGKTQLAIEYGWRYNSDYNVIWWLRSEEATILASDYAALATELDLPEKEAQDQSIIIQSVKKWLNHNANWLLVFDNARDSGSIESYLPTGTCGHVLITSRHQNWNHIGTSLKIEVWSREESLAFLHKRTGQAEDAATGKLVETLGCLPLALEQAAAYCVARKKSHADYFDLFTTRRQELWKRELHPENYPDTVATTWTLAFEQFNKSLLFCTIETLEYLSTS